MQVTVTSSKNWLGAPIRYGTDENQDVWFVLKDIADALGIKNSRDLKARLVRDHPTGVVNTDAQNSRGQMRETTIVLEDLVYAYIVPKSRKPGALKFARWVGKVIKTIRKTGSYTPELALENKKVDMQIIEMTRKFFPNDQRMNFLVQEKLASLMGQCTLGDSKPGTISELMGQDYPAKKILRYRSSVGRMVAKRYRTEYGEPKTTEKLVHGHRCPVKIYPEEHHDVIKCWISDYFSESE